jgi:preprotein translocase subunit SecA
MGLRALYSRWTGDPVQTDLKEYRDRVEAIRSFDFSQKAHLKITGSPGMHEIFALAYEASRRSLGLEPFDTQLIAGLAMSRGSMIELPTGEGKTLAAVFPACFHALSGRGVHVLTFNDYLARRDASWMGPIYEALGLSVGCIQEGMSPSEKRAAYSCDVTYATAKEAGFDFLRDQIAYDQAALVHRPFHFAIVDEADSILIDEARIPLVISGAEDRAAWDTNRIAAIVKGLTSGKDFETDDEHRNVFLTEAGIDTIESLLDCGSLYASGNQSLLEAIYCGLHAEALLRRDVDYIVRENRIEIVDEYTGRVVEKRHWPDGLQAAVEAKEGLLRKTEGRILGSITLQHFFRLYPAISGMTATARSAADEFQEFYGLNTVVIPPHTPSNRVDYPDVVFLNRDAKRQALVTVIRQVHGTGRSILVGTSSVKESEELAADMRTAGIRCAVLNAKNDELEAGIIAKAGEFGAVTISTNMAGRGVDIKLSGYDDRERDAVTKLGGLYVIGTNRHENLRIDRQLRGRAGRQGDPGSTRFYISLDDDLFERYGLTAALSKRYKPDKHNVWVETGSIHREIVHAQRIIESQNFDIRRSLYRFSELVELQRQEIQTLRENALSGGDTTSFQLEPALSEEGIRRFGFEGMVELRRRAALFHIDRIWSDHLAWIQDTRDSIHLVNLGGREPFEEFRRWATEEFLKLRDRIDTAVKEEITVALAKDDIAPDLERLKGPSSTWTYLVNENPFGWGMEMIKGRNIGFAAIAVIAPLAPLFLLTSRLHRKQK